MVLAALPACGKLQAGFSLPRVSRLLCYFHLLVSVILLQECNISYGEEGRQVRDKVGNDMCNQFRKHRLIVQPS